MKIAFARLAQHFQVDLTLIYEQPDLWTVQDEPAIRYCLEIMTVGWENGARTRMRRFRDFHEAFGYANKLLDGKWMSDEEYNLSYLVIETLYQHSRVRFDLPEEVRTRLRLD